MAYSSFVGKRVEVQYRASDLHLTAVGTLVLDSRDSIVLEERFQQNGKHKVMRVEIPYQYIIRVVHAADKTSASQLLPAASSK